MIAQTFYFAINTPINFPFVATAVRLVLLASKMVNGCQQESNRQTAFKRLQKTFGPKQLYKPRLCVCLNRFL